LIPAGFAASPLAVAANRTIQAIDARGARLVDDPFAIHLDFAEVRAVAKR